MKNLLWILLTMISISLNAQTNFHISMDSLLKKIGQGKNDLSNLMDVDLRLIHSMPTIHDYENINMRIKALSNDYIRLLDSVDYFRIGNDTIIVTVYTQNYAYQSGNIYKLGIEKQNKKTKQQSKNDSLNLYNVYYNMSMKSETEDYFVFMNRQFEYNSFAKELGDIKKTKRIIIAKNYR